MKWEENITIKVYYEDIISWLSDDADIDVFRSAIKKCENSNLKHSYDEMYDVYGCQYKEFWISNEIWKIINYECGNGDLFTDYKKYQKEGMMKYNHHMKNPKSILHPKPKALNTYSIKHGIKEQIQCTISRKEATIKFNFFDGGPVNDVVSKHREILDELEYIVALGEDEGLDIRIDHKRITAGKNYNIILKKIEGEYLESFLEGDSRWKIVAKYFGKYSRLMYENIVESIIER